MIFPRLTSNTYLALASNIVKDVVDGLLCIVSGDIVLQIGSVARKAPHAAETYLGVP